MKYHIHHGPYGSRGEARPLSYRDEQGREIASYSYSGPWAGLKSADWITLHAAPNDSGSTKRIDHEEGKAEAIILAHLQHHGFTEHDERSDTWDHRSFCD